MSHLVLCDIGENVIQDLWYDTAEPTLRVSLYKNNYTPIAASVYSSFTKADYTGYADQSPAFGPSTTVGGKATLTEAAPHAFVMGTPGTGNTIYGYYVWSDQGVPGTELLMWAEKFDTPAVLANLGDTINLTLVFTLYSEF